MQTNDSTFEGILIDWFETGLEGVVWALEEEEIQGYSGLHPIDEGDHLTILDSDGNALWSGTIVKDRKTGLATRPFNPNFKQQVALGHWVHWIQQGFTPDEWASFFIRADCDRLRGRLSKAADPTRKPI
ncbi:MAG TPA: hypothetical protein VG944_15125 [Fimbriimonas sp.]|nr:hypothetical protein [Fimbriimonas sp.]